MTIRLKPPFMRFYIYIRDCKGFPIARNIIWNMDTPSSLAGRSHSCRPTSHGLPRENPGRIYPAMEKCSISIHFYPWKWRDMKWRDMPGSAHQTDICVDIVFLGGN